MSQEEPEKTRRPPAIPCAAALGAFGVPARRWATRVDLFHALYQAKDAVETWPLDKPMRLDELAAQVGFSQEHLLRLFHEVFGITPAKMLANRRLELAKSLLTTTSMEVSEIAIELGMSGPSAFGRWFRAQLGLTPTAFRANHAQASSL